jgi:hypothetical protein
LSIIFFVLERFFRATSADWVVEKELPAVLDAVIASRNAKDAELEKLLREFLKVTVFPPSMFRAYKGKEDDRESQNQQPEEKKAKLEPPKLWSKLKELGARPDHARVLIESLSTYGRPLMTDPYLKILSSCSFEHAVVPDPARHGSLIKIYAIRPCWKMTNSLSI